MKQLFAPKPALRLKMSLLLICSAGLMLLDYYYQMFRPFRQAASAFVEPLHHLVDGPFRWTVAFRAHQNLLQKNQDLEEQALIQSAHLQQLSALHLENTRLRALLNVSPRSGEQFVMAEILQVHSDSLIQRIVLNRGRQEGVFLGQAVIDAKGVLGEVIEVMEHSSRAILLSDSGYGIPVENARTGLRGIVIGQGMDQALALQHVPNTIDLEVGDLLMTSGLEGHYPAGYPVGIVRHVTQIPGESFANVQVSPLANYHNNRHVLLIKQAALDS